MLNTSEISRLTINTEGLPICNDLGIALTGSLNSGYYNWWLVALSYVIASLAAYSALSLTRQVRTTVGKDSYFWYISGAFTLGAGIWSMHFIGMLAFKMPMAVTYDLPLTLLSLVIAVAGAGYALKHLGNHFEGLSHRIVVGIVMGSAISAMHYMGMSAMRMSAEIQYDVYLVIASIITAIIASFIALTLAHYFSCDRKHNEHSLKLLSSLVMGVAIAGMHYLGTSAATFYHAAAPENASLPIDSEVLAFSITIVMLMVIGLVVLAISIQRSTSSHLRIIFLILTMTTVTILAGLVTVNLLYRVSYDEHKDHMTEILNGHVRLINSEIKQNKNKSLENIIVLFEKYISKDEHTEVILVRKNGSLITILSNSKFPEEKGKNIPFNLYVVEPMRKAIMGGKGSLVHESYRSQNQVLSIFSSLDKDNLGIVSSVDLREHRDPYFIAATKAAAIAIIFIFLGAALFLGITNPIIRRLQKEINQRNRIENELRHSKEGLEIRVEERTRELSDKNIELDVALDEAKEATRTKSDFLANMSHEIRTPMNGVLGMLHLITESELTKEQNEFVSMAEKSAENLLVLLNDILDISKIEAGKLALENADFDIREEVSDVGSLLADYAHKKDLELAIDIAEDVPLMVKGDSTRFRQILINLTGNAIKFTDKGEVVIRIELIDMTDSHNYLRATVTDTGIGIPLEAQEHVFKMFSQQDSSTTRRFGGTGLGLSISRQLAEMMGGEMGLISKQGEGSEFWFTIKLEVSQASVEGFVARDDFNDIRVLVVDDNETNRIILQKQLTSWGIAHDSCINGRLALEKYKTESNKGNKYDLILLDMMMPEMDGLEVAQHLHKETSPPKIILLSSALDSAGREAADRGDIDVFMLKPVRSSALYNTISTILGEHTVKASSKDSSAITQYVYPDAKVLVVEDNHINQKVILGRLHKVKIEADVANNGKEAIEAISKNNYDLVFMDCHMPVMDGYEATTLIRENEKGKKHITLIAMTANAMEGDKEKCIAVGMDDYISKPIKPEVLQDCLTRWLKEFIVNE